MTVIPPDFLAWSWQLQHVGLSRAAFITGGCRLDTAETDPNDLADLVRGALVLAVGGLATRIDSEVQLGPVVVRIGQDGGDPLVGFNDVITVGGRAMESNAPLLAGLVHKRTATGGRRHRGRWFVPWLYADTEVSDVGVVTTSVVTATQTAVNNTFDQFVTNGLPLVVLHSEGTTAVPVPTTVTQLSVDNRISHQVKRLPR